MKRPGPGRRGAGRSSRTPSSAALGQPGSVLAGVGRRPARHRARRPVVTCAATASKCGRQSRGPRGRRVEHVRAPLLVGDRPRPRPRRRRRRGGPGGDRLALAAALPEGVDHRRRRLVRLVDGDQAVGPPAHPSGRWPRSRPAPTSSGGSSGRSQSRARSTRDQAVVGDLLTRQQAAHDLDALHAAAGCGPPCSATARPVTCSFSASPLPSATQKRPGYISARVAMAWAMTAGW